MNEKVFIAILPMLTSAVVERICKSYNLNEDAAIIDLYGTELYKNLEKEETKVWHYSADKLFYLYQLEKEIGKLELPDY